MALGRVTQNKTPALGRVSRFRPTVQDVIEVTAPGVTRPQPGRQTIPAVPTRIAVREEELREAPERTVLQQVTDLFRERQPSRASDIVREVAQGTARDVAALFKTGETITPQTPDQRLIFGDKPFNLETVGREYAEIVGKGENVNRRVAVGIGVFAGVLSLPFRTARMLKESSRILSKTDDVNLIKSELQRIGVKGEEKEIDALARVFGSEVDPQVIEDTLSSFIKRDRTTAGRAAAGELRAVRTDTEVLEQATRVARAEEAEITRVPRREVTIPPSTVEKISRTTNVDEIRDIITRDLPDLALTGRQAEILSDVLTKVEDISKIRAILERAQFVARAPAPKVEDIVPVELKEVATEAQRFDSADDFLKSAVDEHIDVTVDSKVATLPAERLGRFVLPEKELDLVEVEKVRKDIRVGRRPVVTVDFSKPTEDISIIDGHVRLKAYLDEGVSDIPVIDRTGRIIPEAESVSDFYGKIAAVSPRLAEIPERPLPFPTEKPPAPPPEPKLATPPGVGKEVSDTPDNIKVKETTEDDGLDLMAEQQAGSEYALQTSARDDELIVSNLTNIFADIKGVKVRELQLKFSDEELATAQANYDFALESILDDPARALAKYANKQGELPEVTGIPGKGEFARRGDDIVTELGFVDSETARAAFEKYLLRKERLVELYDDLKNIRHNIRLAKQKDAFVGKEMRKLSAQMSKNLEGMKELVGAAERAGFKKGRLAGQMKYNELVTRLKTRRSKLTAVKRAFNLTGSEMQKIRGTKDPRFMTGIEFDEYLEDVTFKAEQQLQKNKEKVIIEAIIDEKGLKNVENLQRALEFPPIKNMSIEQLISFGGHLAKAEVGDIFLGPRMIQTAKNTDLGDIKTIREGQEAVSKQTKMPYKPVEGSEWDNWMRDTTLAMKDPLHNFFITEWAGKEADFLTRQFQLEEKLTELARASRKSRRARDARLRRAGKIKQALRERVMARLAPEDVMPVRYAETEEAGLADLAKQMTAEEVEFGRYLRGYYQKVYNFVTEDAANRWTLRGVKHSRFKDIYFPHITKKFFERWRDDGFLNSIRLLWSRNQADTKIDFNAFGDRGEVLGYEKFFKFNLKREEAADFSRNAVRTTLAYNHTFQRKIILDAMIPKIKLSEFLMGKRFETPKSITNPAGTEKVHSELRKHINMWINNKKGQRASMAYAQGSRAETVIDGIRTFISIQHLGGNIFAQVISGLGGEAATLAGTPIKGWAKGHARAVTKQGRKLGREHAGVIGEPPWNALATAANDAGDTLRNGLFYIFGDLAYRARRQMFLGLLTKTEFKTGKITSERAAQIKLQIGQWHQMPEFRSIKGATSEVKAAGMYTEWAIPPLQTVNLVLLPRLRNMARTTPIKEWPKLARTEEFQTLMRSVVSSAGLAAAAYLILNPDENDRSTVGYMKRKAAQEIGTIVQAVTVWGVPIPGSVFIGYLEQLKNAVGTLISMEQYQTYGPGHKAGDLKGPPQLKRVLLPRGIQQFLSEPETPPKTIEDIRREIKEGIETGELSTAAAKKKLISEIKKLEKKKEEKLFALTPEDYRLDLKKRIEDKEITSAEAKEELRKYLKKRADEIKLEKYDNTKEHSFIKNVKVYAEAIGTDPVTAFQFMFTGEKIRRTDEGVIIVFRGKARVEEEQLEFALQERRQRGATADLMLDHTVPLQLGGSNADKNLKLVPKEDWERYTPVENFLGQALRSGDIDGKKAQQLIQDFKDGKITSQDVYASVRD